MMKKIKFLSILMLMSLMAGSVCTSCGGDDASDSGKTPGGNGGGGSSQPTTIVGEWWCMYDRKTGKEVQVADENTAIDVLVFMPNGQGRGTTYYYSPRQTERLVQGWNYEEEDITYTITGNQCNVRYAKGNTDSFTYTIASDNRTTILILKFSDGHTATFGIMTNEMRSIINSLNAVKKGSGSSNTGYNPCPDNNHPHLVDLGLPSGTKWACCNVGASVPDLYGDRYYWGGTTPLAPGVEDDRYGYPYWSYDGKDEVLKIPFHIGKTQYDAAYVTWGGEWYMPSENQCQELCENTTYQWTSLNGVEGIEVTGRNGNSIFLPAGGGRWNGDRMTEGTGCSYWTSNYNDGGYARILCFKNGESLSTGIDYVQRGHYIRPVQGGNFGISVENFYGVWFGYHGSWNGDSYYDVVSFKKDGTGRFLKVAEIYIGNNKYTYQIKNDESFTYTVNTWTMNVTWNNGRRETIGIRHASAGSYIYFSQDWPDKDDRHFSTIDSDLGMNDDLRSFINNYLESPQSQKVVFWEGEFTAESWDSAPLCFSNTLGKYFPTLPNEVFSGLKTLVVDVKYASEGCTGRVMNSWWTTIFEDNIPLTSGMKWEIKITSQMVQDSTEYNGVKVLNLLLTNGTATFTSVYYYR